MKPFENHLKDARYNEMPICPTVVARYGTGGNNVPLVLMDQGGGVMSIEYDKVGTLRAQTHGHEPLILNEEPLPINTQTVQGRHSDNGRMGSGIGKPGDQANTLQANHSHGVFDMQARVRKLTPVETERLQGFEDNYTRIPWKGKPSEECPDSPRYRAIGNSWSVPCVRWIGQRIQAELEKNK